MKKLLAILLTLALVCVPLAACDDPAPAPSGGGDAPSAGGDAPSAGGDAPSGGGDEVVTLRLWGGEDDQAMLRERADAFIASVADQVTLVIELGIESESTVRDTILTDPQAAADVFAMADDQMMSLYNAGVLQPVLLNPDVIRAENVGAAVELATIDGELYAYPLTADNGYFMFYDKSYFTEDDVKSLDRMMEVAAENGKQITMHIANGWYSIAFMRAVGLDAWLTDDGKAGCDFNGPGGADVLQAMLDIVANPGFIALPDSDFTTVINDGSVIAGVNGPWNAPAAAEAWGDNYAAAKLPTFTLNGEQVQMSGVVGCKLIGVNAFSENVGYAMMLAEFLTSYESQVIRFEQRGAGPTNIQAGASDAVQANPAQAAVAAQAAHSYPMITGDNYWTPAESLFAIIAQGNPSGLDLQEILDTAVADITS